MSSGHLRRCGPAIVRALCAGLILSSAGILISCSRAPGRSGFTFPEQPNIILVVADALRRDHLGLYGYDRPTTPFLDSLADEAIVVEDAWSSAPETLHSISSLFTSRHFSFLGRNEDYEPIPGLTEEIQHRHALAPRFLDANSTLAELLRKAGYQTLGVFTNPHHHSTSGFWQGFDRPVFLPPTGSNRPYASGADVYYEFFDWLDGRESTDTPFFAYLHLMEPHNPYRPPKHLRRIFVDRPGDDVFVTGKPEHPPDAVDLAFTTALYDGEIRFTDGVVREMVGELERRGLWSDTLLVFTSDHGDELMDHGGMGHGTTLHRELLRIPLLFAGAGLERHPGRKLLGVVSILDLAPTLVAVADAPVPGSFQGRSLLPLIEAGPLRTPSDAIALARGGGSLRSVVDRRWHLIADLDSGEYRLYDRIADPDERIDLGADEDGVVHALAQHVADLEAERLEMESLVRLAGKDRLEVEIDPAILEQLEALGYLGQ